MTVWAKKLADGSVAVGETVYAPTFTLLPGDPPQDGWVEYPSDEAAYAALIDTHDPVSALASEVADLKAQIAALLTLLTP